MWPRDLRKKKPYTADELLAGGCEHAAERIKKARGSGEIVYILPPELGMFLGPVYPPGGGEITNWVMNCVVRDGERIYDKMTGPDGMTIEDYSQLFENWDALTTRTMEEEL